jgi:competence protein ComEA
MPLTPRDALAVGGAALAALALGGAAWLAFAPSDEAAGPPAAAAAAPSAGISFGASVPAASPSGAQVTELLVDVQGAVRRPGIVRIPAGSRVADAIAAAGGYSAKADLLAAASAINLAATLADGAQVIVPIQGVAAAPAASVPGAPAAGGLVNLNTASAEALEALPGIGPVTVQKILAARAERPFTTLEELLQREVMHSGQLEDIRALVTL